MYSKEYKKIILLFPSVLFFVILSIPQGGIDMKTKDIKKYLAILCASVSLFMGCIETKVTAEEGESEALVDTDKFALWQTPGYFRGAAVHPYVCFGCEEEYRKYTTLEDFKALRETGGNVVSLNYPGPFQVDTPHDIDEEALLYLDKAIDWAEEAGLYVIIHFRNGPGKAEETFYGEDGTIDETLWYSEEEQEKWVEQWRFVAERYKGYRHVVAYNLMVEPHPETTIEQEPLPASVWNELAKEITTGIREVDADTPIIVDATVWANPVGFSELEATGDTKTIYSFHLYEPFQFTHQGFDWAGLGGGQTYEYPGPIPSDLYEETRHWDRGLIEEFLEPVKKFQRENAVPIFVGEFGCNRRVPSCVSYLKDLFAIFNDEGWSHTIYIWRDDDGFAYDKGVAGDEPREDSEYLQLFREEWSGNDYFPNSPSPENTLKTLVARHGIRIGSFYDYAFNDATHDKIFAEEFNAMTVGMFWGGVLYPDGPELVFSETDKVMSLAKALGMEIFSQTLVWFDDIPEWLKATPLNQVETVMNKHIDTVVGRYRGEVDFWNVVNEAIDENGNIRLNHRWAEAMGADYISKAFIRAHAADPNSILYYNEYDIETNEAKFNGTKKLLQDLQGKGIPVHALGWQMHVKPGSFDPATLLARLNEIADMGLDNYITELDVELPEEPTAADYEAQKQTYKLAIETFLKARRHKTLVFWGLRDGSPYWLTNGHPLLFDENFTKKPAYDGVQEALWEF